jgi:hypothetical protein
MESSQPSIFTGRRRVGSWLALVRMATDPAGLCLMLAMSVFWLYRPAIGFGSTGYDDPVYFAQNPHVQAGLSWDGMLWAFKTGLTSNWHPLTWLSLMFDTTMAGTLDPAVTHFTNIVLHATNSVLLFLLLHHLTGARWRSLFAAGCFALHPLNVESVVWISERKNVLSTSFWLLTIFAYARYVQGMAGEANQATRTKPAWPRFTFHASRFYWLALVFFALGLMSKPMLVTLPFVLLLLDDWPWGRWRMTSAREWKARLPGLAWEKAPFFLLSALSCVVTILVQQHGKEIQSLDRLPLGGRMENTLVCYLRYLGKTCWPTQLAVHYPHPGHWPFWLAVSAAAFIVAFSLAVIRLGKQNRCLITGWFWFLGTLVPVIGLVQVGAQSMADRYAYVPLIGIFIMISWGGFQILAGLKFPGMAMFAAAGLLLLAGAGLARHQLNYWQNDGTLFRHALAVTKSNAVAHLNLGVYLGNNGELDEAIRNFRETLDIETNGLNAMTAHYNLGYLMNCAGQPAEAEKEYREAIRIDPDYYPAHYNLGISLNQLGRREEAIEQFLIALRLKPDMPDPRQQLQALGVEPH